MENTLYVLGGSPCSGKSAAAEELVKRYGCAYFKFDDYLDDFIRRGAARGNALLKRVLAMTPEQNWMRDPQAQCNEEWAIYEAIAPFAYNEIQRLGQKRPVLAEGAGLLPPLMSKKGLDARHACYVVPSKGFQISHYRERNFVKYVLAGCTDTEAAFERWMERDALFALRVRKEAAELGYESYAVDGSRPLADTVAFVEECFGLTPPEAAAPVAEPEG